MTHSEIRQDYIHDRVVIIAPGRKKRTHDFPSTTIVHGVSSGPCIFCAEQQRGVSALDTIGGKQNWKVKAIKNAFPIVDSNNPHAYGYQEVIIDTPDHNTEFADLPVAHIESVLELFGRRIKAVERDRKIKYILTFKNHGGKAGATIVHAHSQIFASSFLPPHIVDKRTRAEGYAILKGTCYYEDLLKREKKGPRWIAGDEHIGVFAPYASSYNYEAWLIPWRHVDNVSNITQAERHSLAYFLKRLLQRLETIQIPYNLFAHQVVRDNNEHFYFRVSPRGDVWAGLELGSRLIVNTIPPEDAAAFYREDTTKRKK